MKKRHIKRISFLSLLIILLPTAFSESIQIMNLGQIGFNETSQEYTSLRTVILEIAYTQNASCRFSNDNNTWTQFEPCTSQKY
jgi:hypothetical protein